MMFSSKKSLLYGRDSGLSLRKIKIH